MSSRNLAARAGRWSAAHRKTAIFGWLGLVIVAMFIGGAVGTKTIKDEDQGSGQSREAQRAINSNFPKQASESVLVQARAPGVTASSPKLSVRRSTTSLPPCRSSGTWPRSSRRWSVRTPGRSPRTAARRSSVRAARRRRPGQGPRRAGRGRGGRGAEAQPAAADRGVRRRQREQGARQGVRRRLPARPSSLSLPITLLILVIAFGALVAAGIPLLLGLTAVAATLGLLALLSQLMPGRRVDQLGDPAHRARRRRRLLAVLPAPRARGARARTRARGALEIAAATSGRAVLISGLTVMIAMAGMFLDRHATFMASRIGTILVVAVAMLGSLTVLPALLSLARRPGRQGPDPVPRRAPTAAAASSRVWSWILDRVLRHPVSRPSLAGRVLVALAIPALGCTRSIGRPRPAAGPADHADLRPHPDGVPGQPAARVVVVQADDVTAPAVTAGDQVAASARRSPRGQMSEPVDVYVSPQHGRGRRPPDGRATGTDARRSRRWRAARRRHPRHDRPGRRRRQPTSRADRRLEGLQRPDEVARAARVRVRPRRSRSCSCWSRSARSSSRIKAIVLNLLSVAAAYGVLVWCSRTATRVAARASSRSAGSPPGCRCSCS